FRTDLQAAVAERLPVHTGGSGPLALSDAGRAVIVPGGSKVHADSVGGLDFDSGENRPLRTAEGAAVVARIVVDVGHDEAAVGDAAEGDVDVTASHHRAI